MATKRCASGQFKDHPIIRQIVGRVHVGDANEDVLTYARSRLARGAWDRMSAKDRRAFECEVIKQHEGNRRMYQQVMRGSSRRRR